MEQFKDIKKQDFRSVVFSKMKYKSNCRGGHHSGGQRSTRTEADDDY